MALRSGHGNGAGVPRVEVVPADELPGVGVPMRKRPSRKLTSLAPRPRRRGIVVDVRRVLGARGARHVALVRRRAEELQLLPRLGPR
jgi:hypothetical protein